MSADVIIIGGGVIGAMTAYHLADRGKRVTLLDKDGFGAACSHGNCGYISPSHVLPLTQPGILRKTMFTAFKKSSPLYIKPRLSPTLFHWLTRFALRCNERDMMEAAGALHTLLQSSRRRYGEILEQEQIDCDWEEGGLMFVYRTPEHFEHYVETAKMLAEKFGLAIDRIEREKLVEMEPALKPDVVAGAYEFPDDAHLRPDMLMRGLRRVLEQRGVEILEGRAMTGFERRNGHVTAVKTAEGNLDADTVVVATGAVTPLLNTHLGCRIPIQPGKGYSLTMGRPGVCPNHPMIFEQDRVAITPWKSGYRIGSTMEFSGYDATLNPARLENLRRGATRYLKEPTGEPTVEEWCGWRPMTWDSLPIIDRSPTIDNVFIAAGHNMLGLSLAAATGQLVAEMATGATPHVDPTPYRVTRF